MLLPPQASAITTKLAILIHDTVAGNQERDSIRSVGMSDCALSRRGTDAACELLIRTSFAIRDAQQFVSDAHLERSARINEGQIKLSQLPREIRIELFLRFNQMIVFTGNDRARKQLFERR